MALAQPGAGGARHPTPGMLIGCTSHPPVSRALGADSIPGSWAPTTPTPLLSWVGTFGAQASRPPLPSQGLGWRQPRPEHLLGREPATRSGQKVLPLPAPCAPGQRCLAESHQPSLGGSSGSPCLSWFPINSGHRYRATPSWSYTGCQVTGSSSHCPGDPQGGTVTSPLAARAHEVGRALGLAGEDRPREERRRLARQREPRGGPSKEPVAGRGGGRGQAGRRGLRVGTTGFRPVRLCLLAGLSPPGLPCVECLVYFCVQSAGLNGCALATRCTVAHSCLPHCSQGPPEAEGVPPFTGGAGWAQRPSSWVKLLLLTGLTPHSARPMQPLLCF